jgi:AraC-like DNA-binding protein
MKHKITVEAVQRGRSLKARVTDYIMGLGPDDAVPLEDLRTEFNISSRHLRDVMREMKCSMHLLIEDKPTVCAVHPKTAEKHNARARR